METILIVDDEKNYPRILGAVLEDEGFEILTANSSVQALEILHASDIDLVLTDMRMPEMDGAQFLEQVQQRWPNIVRILLTGYADITSTINAINKGKIFSYISKPWDDNDITVEVKRALEYKGLQKERNRLLALSQKQNAELKELRESEMWQAGEQVRSLRPDEG